MARRCIVLTSLLAVACLPSEDLSSYSAPGAAGAGGAGGAPDGGAPAGGGTGGLPMGGPDAAAGAGGTPPAAPVDASASDAGADTAEGSGDASVVLDASASNGEPPVDAAALATCSADASLGPNGQCFVALPALVTWAEARIACQARGAGWDLAKIESAELNDFVAVMLPFEAWMGGSDAAVEGAWRWVSDGVQFWSGNGTTGTAVDGAFDAWNADEPNGGGPSDCARVLPVATGAPTNVAIWADLECDQLRGTLCSGPPS